MKTRKDFNYNPEQLYEMHTNDPKQLMILQANFSFNELEYYYINLKADINTNNKQAKESWTAWTTYCYRSACSFLRVVKKNNKILTQIEEPIFKVKYIEDYLKKYKENYDYQKARNEQIDRKEIRKQERNR
jgi:hypothetical protein